MKKIRNSKKGFTLVEIMCVVAIIVILLSAVGTGIYDTYRRSKNSVIVVGNEHNEQLQDVTTAADQAMAGNQVTAGSEEKSATTGNQVAAEAQGHSGQAMNSLANPTGGSAPLGGVSATIIEAAPDEATTEEARKTAVDAVLGNKLSAPDNDKTTLGSLILSCKPEEIREKLKSQGIEGVDVFSYSYTGGNFTPYTNALIQAHGISPSDYANGKTKIYMVTTDGKSLEDRKIGDEVEVVQYLYYQAKYKTATDTETEKAVTLLATRTTKVTLTKKTYKDSLKFDMSGNDYNTWNYVK